MFLSEFGLPCRWLVPFGEDNLALAVSRLNPSASSRLGPFDGFVYPFFSTKGVAYARAAERMIWAGTSFILSCSCLPMPKQTKGSNVYDSTKQVFALDQSGAFYAQGYPIVSTSGSVT